MESRKQGAEEARDAGMPAHGAEGVAASQTATGAQAPVASFAVTGATSIRPGGGAQAVSAEFARAENEDDDGYDPWSDRPPTPEPLFERDPWG